MKMPARQAFTLVEMLVSMALILFIMVILSTAFTTGLQVFRQLKGLGDMEERLRSTAQILRRDLSAYHFENYRKLSDTTFWTDGSPQQGFFRLWQASPSSSEGADGDGIPSTRATGHMLHFTSKLSGQGQGDFATSSLPTALSLQALVTSNGDNRYQQSGQFRGRWFEVAYFLRPNQLSAGGSGSQLFTLYRRQLGVLDTTGVNPSLASQLNGLSTPVKAATGVDLGNFSEISYKKAGDMFAVNPANATSYPDTIVFNSPADLTMPIRRFAMLPGAAGSAEMAGIPADRLLSLSSSGGYPITNRSYPILGEVPSDQGWPTASPALGANPPAWSANSGLAGADVLLSDVISFEIKALFQGSNDFTDIPTGNNTLLASAGIGVFDTWSNRKDNLFDYSNSATGGTTNSAPITSSSIQALKITIRIWDAKTLQARQITIIQDM